MTDNAHPVPAIHRMIGQPMHKRPRRVQTVKILCGLSAEKGVNGHIVRLLSAELGRRQQRTGIHGAVTSLRWHHPDQVDTGISQPSLDDGTPSHD